MPASPLLKEDSMNLKKYIIGMFIALSTISASFQARAGILKGSHADMLISALKAAGVAPAQGSSGEALFAVSSLWCSTPDGSNMDENFLSTCEYLQSNQRHQVVKGSQADAIIYALRVLHFNTQRQNGAELFSVRRLICSTPDGSNMDETFNSSCDVLN